MDHMGDESVCELLEVGLGMLARARLTEGLRNSAGVCVQAVVRAVFTRLKTLTPEGVEKLVQASKEIEEKEKATAQASKRLQEGEGEPTGESSIASNDTLPVTTEKLKMDDEDSTNREDVAEGQWTYRRRVRRS